MVGVLKSTACQLCKDRKLKCDQKWPTCSACARKGFECPGASSLVKFVTKTTAGTNQQRSQYVAGPSSTGKDAIARSRIIRERRIPMPRGGMVTIFRSDGGGEPPKHHSPAPRRPMSSSPTDFAASCLVYTMKKESYLKDGFLRYMPSRLGRSELLRDVVNLYCSAMTDHWRDLSAGSITTLKLYDRALRSLRQTLKGNQAMHVDTLASVTLLTRAEAFFDPAWCPYRYIHATVMINLAKLLGPPKAGDLFHVGTLYETFDELTFHAFTNNEKSFMEQSPWKEWFTTAAEEKTFYLPGLVSHATTISKLNITFCGTGPGLVEKVREVYKDPHTPAMETLAMKLLSAFHHDYEKGFSVFTETVDRVLEVGAMREISDPTCLGGKYYELGSNGCKLLCNCILGYLVGCARMRYDLSVLYGWGDSGELWADYRRTSALMWRFIPHYLEAARILGSRSLLLLALTYESAEEKERDLLHKALWDQDRHRRLLPRDPAVLGGWITIQAQALTGRLPMS